jgi:hypothetical protein
MRISSMVAVLAAALSGCGTIYVGNVSFTSVEVCSEELASRLHPHSGCLPVTRAENVQGFYYTRFRVQLSPKEAADLTDSPKSPGKNLVPSWIGRVFVANADSDAGKDRKWLVPVNGNLDFLPLGNATSQPESAIPSEIQFQTDFSGVVQKKFEASVELDPAKIVESALGAGAIPPAVSDVLVKKMIQAGIGSKSFDAGKGKYTYVSMSPPQLDSLTNALALCGWRVVQATNRQEQETSGSRPRAAWRGKPRSGCSQKLAAVPSVRDEVKTLLRDVEALARDDIEVVGIVIGVAILHTDKGRSDICSDQEIKLVDRGESPGAGTTCEKLWTQLKDLKLADGLTSDAKSAGATAGPDSDPTQILRALNAEYSRAAYKAIDIQPHTSILAIHWIPALVAD